ncbi:unnamed protein product [Clavelina lepadiformis]|uniref:Uncharacterized protein n=1 Tax=Clavelina lepadiformis TaxID=159417 RepID=A0ABP0GV71_CLALP
MACFTQKATAVLLECPRPCCVFTERVSQQNNSHSICNIDVHCINLVIVNFKFKVRLGCILRQDLYAFNKRFTANDQVFIRPGQAFLRCFEAQTAFLMRKYEGVRIEIF